MKTKFSRKYIIDNCGCYSEEPDEIIKLLGDSKSVTIDQIYNCDIPLKEKFWFVCKKCKLKDSELREIAIDVATIVLPIYENEFPGDDRPRNAIEAAKNYINDVKDNKYESNAVHADYAINASHAAVHAAHAASFSADDKYYEKLKNYLLSIK